MILLQKGLYKFSTNSCNSSFKNEDEEPDVVIKKEHEDLYEASEYHEDGVIEPEIKILDESEFLDFSGDLNFGWFELFMFHLLAEVSVSS